MLPAAHQDRRQLWNAATRATSADPSSTASVHHCTPFALPSLGIISIDATSTLTLTADAVFTPECTVAFDTQNSQAIGGPSSITDMRDPFNSSVTPQVFATGAATVLAWMLVIMLLITPRTFFVGGSGGTSGLLGRRGMISGASGGASIIGVGSRPWLQKVAALTVAISMTMATADTFRVAEKQYEAGYMDAMALRDEVVGGMEIKVSRIISDIFLWLAQVQTLIRLFSRHKEKVIIKWVGFALIVLDMTFSILNSFLGNSTARARHFENAIPALNYLFQCALSMLYAAWVLYYAITKRRYAFYHSMMPNITLVAILSVVAILTPLAFFITDISNYNVAGWGDYFRWVGAAAASVIVWEWVERIEALEREEKKDGILGREVFDGDDMLEVAAPEEVNWPRNRHSQGVNGKRGSGGGGGGGGGFSSGVHAHGHSALGQQIFRHKRESGGIMVPLGRAHTVSPGQKTDTTGTTGEAPAFSGYAPVPTPPPAVASPVNRTETTSASTVYTVRYHTINEPFTPQARRDPSDAQPYHQYDDKDVEIQDDTNQNAAFQAISNGARLRWGALPNPFRKQKASPPQEVLGGQVIESLRLDTTSPTLPTHNYSRWDLKSRFGAFAAEQSEKLRDKANGKPSASNLPVTIIPAQPRGRTWSPDNLAQQQDAAHADEQPAVPTETSHSQEAIAHLGMSPMNPLNQPTFSSSNRPYTAESSARRSTLTPATPSSPTLAQGGNQVSTLPPSDSARRTDPFASPFLSPTTPTSPTSSENPSVTPNSPGRPDAAFGSAHIGSSSSG